MTTEGAEKETCEEEKEILRKEHQKFALFDLKIDTLIQRYISYARWRDFLKPIVTKSNLNIENLN